MSSNLRFEPNTWRTASAARIHLCGTCPCCQTWRSERVGSVDRDPDLGCSSFHTADRNICSSRPDRWIWIPLNFHTTGRATWSDHVPLECLMKIVQTKVELMRVITFSNIRQSRSCLRWVQDISAGTSNNGGCQRSNLDLQGKVILHNTSIWAYARHYI